MVKEAAPPRVFISYSHDSEAHSAWVLELAQRMRSEGIDARIDRFEPDPAEGWPVWMEKQFRDADFILLICTEIYARRFDGLEKRKKIGRGVHWEAGLIRQELYDERKNHRILVAVLDSTIDSAIPAALGRFTKRRLPSQYVDLYRAITGQPAIVPAPLGKLKVLQPLSRGVPAIADDTNAEEVEQSATTDPVISSTSSVNKATRPRLPHPVIFDPYTPARGVDFVGRETELGELLFAVDRGQSISIVGDWRIGKTSLAEAYVERARMGGRKVRMLSGEGREGANSAALVQELTGTQTNGAEAAADALDLWARRETIGNLRPSLVIDEFDDLVARLEPRFLERLRGMLDRLHLVLVTTREIDLIYTEIGRTSPFYNRLRSLFLGLIDRSSYEKLIDRGRDIFDAADRLALWEWSGRHPFFACLFARHLVAAHSESRSRDEALNRFRNEAAGRLRDIWRTLNEKERRALIACRIGQEVDDRSLQRRGLVLSTGLPFGRLIDDMIDEMAT